MLAGEEGDVKKIAANVQDVRTEGCECAGQEDAA